MTKNFKEVRRKYLHYPFPMRLKGDREIHRPISVRNKPRVFQKNHKGKLNRTWDWGIHKDEDLR